MFLSGKKYKRDETREIILMGVIHDTDEYEKINQEVFTEFYYRISVPVWANLLKKWVPPKVETDIEDPFQESWIKILDKRKSYKKGSKPFPWCFTIFSNSVKNFFDLFANRKRDSINANEENEHNSLIKINGQLVVRENSIYDKIYFKYITEKLDEAIEIEMQPIERKTIKMYLEGYTQREIAEKLNKSVGMTNKIIKHAREIIENYLLRNDIDINNLNFE
jgi:RNA polymerase sigma factor (sigma-70 family)